MKAVKVSVYLPADLERQLREEAARLERSISWVVARRLRMAGKERT